MKIERKCIFEPTNADPWFLPAAEQEALGLLQLVGRNGDSAETIRQLIRVSPKEEEILRAFAAEHPRYAAKIEAVLQFRGEVAKLFEKLLASEKKELSTKT